MYTLCKYICVIQFCSYKHVNWTHILKINFLPLQLAADAEKPIPMTEEEKVRIEGLLQDIDSLPELPEELDQIGVSII